MGLAWLGQAGFALRHEHAFLLIDPYLSDHLAEKYRGTEFPHVRMMPPPIAAANLPPVTAVLCTHRHSDHMDPAALPIVAAMHPACRFVVPRAEREAAERIGLPPGRLVTVDAGETAEIAPGIVAVAVPAAHETLRQNERGEHHFLGYVIRLGRVTLYHSGDCVPYGGLAERLRREAIDVALLPVNGRDAYRRERGVPGNMDWNEAVALCLAAGIPRLVPHHFGMFNFNTVDQRALGAAAAAAPPAVRCLLPSVETHYVFHCEV